MLKNIHEAVAFAMFLVWEKKRHLDDILMIDQKLHLISKKWGINVVANGKKWVVDGVELSESEMWIDEKDI